MTLRHEDVEGLYANARAEVVRLRFINADLLAALGKILDYALPSEGGTLDAIADLAQAAIAKAERD